ncbi:MAG: hypothetical protein IJ046_04960, partial [Clostridia bacterium]|nr:hypothetical protein [Clostridia bacterium]
DFRRVKVKSPDYIMMHRLKQTGVLSKRECITMILDRREKIEGVCRENPDLEHVFRYYEYKLSELRYTARRLALFACRLYEEYSRDRGAVAGVIGKHPLAMVAFRALETGESGDDIFDRLPCEKKIKLIPDYEPVDIRRVFGV